MKKEVCVITGGGSGMGLAAAKYMPKEKIILVTGRTLAKLERAVTELQEAGYEDLRHLSSFSGAGVSSICRRTGRNQKCDPCRRAFPCHGRS